MSIQVHSPVALSTADGEAAFGLDNATKRGFGSSLVLEHRMLDGTSKKGKGLEVGTSTIRVRTVDALRFLRTVDGPIALKLDVEGSEYTILRDLLLSGLLCERVHNLFVEWQDPPRNLPAAIQASTRWMLETHNSNHSALSRAWLPHGHEGCVTHLSRWA